MLLEKYVIRRADWTISNTQRAKAKRLELGLSKNKSIVINNGVFIPHTSFIHKKIKNDCFIYIGDVTAEHGLLDFLQRHHTLIKKLTVVGQGEEWEQTKKFCATHKIKTIFYHKRSHDFVLKTLKNFQGFGLAPYTSKNRWTYYCSPLKINEYISSGIPVVISDVPEVAKEIAASGLGLLYGKSTNTETLSRKLFDFNTNNFHTKAKAFYQSRNYDVIYRKLPLNFTSNTDRV